MPKSYKIILYLLGIRRFRCKLRTSNDVMHNITSESVNMSGTQLCLVCAGS